MTTHFGILDWKILWAEEPGRLHSMGRKELDRLTTHTHTHTHTHTEPWEIVRKCPYTHTHSLGRVLESVLGA